MILADSTIPIELLKTGSPKLRHIITSEPAAICGVTVAEVLHGARGQHHRQRLIVALGLFRLLPIGDNLWEQIGDNFAALRAGGVTVSLGDVVIATVAVSNGIELWTRDKDFQDVQRILPQLKLFQEPP